MPASYLVRAALFAQRFRISVRLFGLRGSLRLFFRDKVRPGQEPTVLRMKTLGRDFWYRPARDRDTVIAHLCRPLYRFLEAGRPLTTIVDAGAHIGDETIRFRHFHPTARIFAIEADPAHADVLRSNCREDARTTVYNRALWPPAGTVRIASGPCAQASHVSSEGVPVETITMDDVLRDCGGKIDLLKIDIEGAEGALFGDERSQEWLVHVSALVVECADHEAPGTTLRIADALRKTGREWSCAIVDENLVWTRNDVPWGIDKHACLV